MKKRLVNRYLCQLACMLDAMPSFGLWDAQDSVCAMAEQLGVLLFWLLCG